MTKYDYQMTLLGGTFGLWLAGLIFLPGVSRYVTMISLASIVLMVLYTHSLLSEVRVAKEQYIKVNMGFKVTPQQAGVDAYFLNLVHTILDKTEDVAGTGQLVEMYLQGDLDLTELECHALDLVTDPRSDMPFEEALNLSARKPERKEK
jgi:hypothetical protein